ncbi:hypothetical protein L917_04795 [Phytophthora nicotianae]|uniref:Uncharacterized protein n=1 Tax=Phytophthora nicotianae TaxID=4792 RepID=W2H8N6_PHYNI|nr:hypothetical protein L915_04949 [Phytophthora nicotianae]ETL44900.1 hypothetical protein L916_04896 [Phytophthora nicotianae]ETL98054.1 hypothetical protein L917_04795 [Phytophthora nicotianae]
MRSTANVIFFPSSEFSSLSPTWLVAIQPWQLRPDAKCKGIL